MLLDVDHHHPMVSHGHMIFTQVQMQKPSQAKLNTKDGFDVKVPNNLVSFLVNLYYIPPGRLVQWLDW